MASNSIQADDNPNVVEERFIHYEEMNVGRDKVKSVHSVMNRIVVVLSNCQAVYIDGGKKFDTVSLLT